MTDAWAERALCPDGACTGIISGDGHCTVCGRAAPFWGDERRRGMTAEADHDADEAAADDRGPPAFAPERELCPDGACVGVIGDDGRCGECGRAGPAAVAVTAVVPPKVAAPALDDGDDRRLCPDGACVGLLDAAGVCKVCGRSAEAN